MRLKSTTYRPCVHALTSQQHHLTSPPQPSGQPPTSLLDVLNERSHADGDKVCRITHVLKTKGVHVLNFIQHTHTTHFTQYNIQQKMRVLMDPRHHTQSTTQVVSRQNTIHTITSKSLANS